MALLRSLTLGRELAPKPVLCAQPRPLQHPWPVSPGWQALPEEKAAWMWALCCANKLGSPRLDGEHQLRFEGA